MGVSQHSTIMVRGQRAQEVGCVCLGCFERGGVSRRLGRVVVVVPASADVHGQEWDAFKPWISKPSGNDSQKKSQSMRGELANTWLMEVRSGQSQWPSGHLPPSDTSRPLSQMGKVGLWRRFQRNHR